MEIRKKMAADNNNIDHNHAALLPRPWHLAPGPLAPAVARCRRFCVANWGPFPQYGCTAAVSQL